MPMSSSRLPNFSQIDPSRPRLAIATGDPAGIGPEVVLKALADPAVRQVAEITVVGTRSQLLDSYQRLREENPEAAIAHPDDFNLIDIPWDVPVATVSLICEPGQETPQSGEMSFRYLEAAIAHVLDGHADGVVTAPIAKSAWKAAGHHYPGQTELLAEKAGVDRFGMMFVARSPHTGWMLRTLLATTHIPLRDVPTALTPELMTRKLDLLYDCLHRDFGIASPRIAISGLNPHSGEQGQLGREEQDWLHSWLQAMGDRHPQVTLDGLTPPDTLWVKPGQAWFGTRPSVNAHDAYLALYHDQGLIPVKLMAFDRAVNTTIGLPFVRTSPDHGTAFDIAGRGIADPKSMMEAIRLGAELVAQRTEQGAIAQMQV
ncbi:MAG: 4-hydroxythreonine-4-phosphate dehydrogenase PdxA [Elainellaceae cyanobacterium]